MTAQDLYNQAVKPLPVSERLRLAAMILNDVTAADAQYSDEWTDEDLRDFSKATWEHINRQLEDEENAEGG